MKFFIDTANIDEIKELAVTGMIDGVTTNPSLIAKSGRDIKEVISEICKIVKGPVSAEVTAEDFDGMMKEADVLRKIANNIAVKLPLTMDGLRACKYLSSENTMTNVTLCFSAGQALLAAKAGATFISPFVGRIDDLGNEGMQLIEEIATIYANYDFDTEILVASVRNVAHVTTAAMIGAHVATIPPKILKQLYKHPLTDSGLKAFNDDWATTGQSIL